MYYVRIRSNEMIQISVQLDHLIQDNPHQSDKKQKIICLFRRRIIDTDSDFMPEYQGINYTFFYRKPFLTFLQNLHKNVRRFYLSVVYYSLCLVYLCQFHTNACVKPFIIGYSEHQRCQFSGCSRRSPFQTHYYLNRNPIKPYDV